MPFKTNNEQRTTNNAAAIRHAVYRDLLEMMPVASFEQAMQFAANLRLRARTPQARSAALTRFLGLRVTPDIAETPYRGGSIKEIESLLGKKYGNHLQHVAGFHRLDDASPFRLNLPDKCVLYGYGSRAYQRASVLKNSQSSILNPQFYFDGILCQPLNTLNSFFLLSSSKIGGAKALRLSPRDQQYFTQYEEVNV